MFKLPDLPYNYNALESFIDEATMKIHHLKHHQTYVDKLNSTLEKYPKLGKLSIEELLSNLDKVPDEIKQAVINFGGGHYNHSVYWQGMCPPGLSKVPAEGRLFDAITSTFTNFEDFKLQFTEKAMSVFGSGWVFLIKTSGGKLMIKRHSFQNSPIMHGNKIILSLDLWEHAYYLKYQNRRNEYVDSWWNVVNWQKAEEMLVS